MLHMSLLCLERSAEMFVICSKTPKGITRSALRESFSEMLSSLVPRKADWLVNDVVLAPDRPLERDSLGEVFEATWKGSLVAAKKLHANLFKENNLPEKENRQMIKEFMAECAQQALLRHPNIVPLFGVFLPPGGRDKEQAPVMISELMAETLRGRVLRAPRLSIRDVVDAGLQIASALRYLHERPEPIVHRDLSANIVKLSFSGTCKIGDVGLAKVFTKTGRLARTVQLEVEPYMPGEALIPGSRCKRKAGQFLARSSDP